MARFTDYEQYDATGLADLVRRKEVTPGELLETAVALVEERNPAINAVVFLDPELGRRAIDSGLPEGPFTGVPFLLKDLYQPCAGLPMSNGCRLWDGYVPDYDSEMVARYKCAGLVIFGRTASPEFGLTTTTESRVHGKTRNPWNLEHTSGGSSGGASAAVASGILPLANASDGGGSIRIPATCTGLFGMKPTRGRTPAGPDAGEGWAGMSTVHCVSRSVRDSARLLDATAGPDLGAPYWAVPPQRPFAEAAARANPGKLRIGLQTEAFNGIPVHPDCVEAATKAAALCRSLGHEVEEAQVTFEREPLARSTNTIIGANIRATVLDRAAQLGRDYTEDDIELVTQRMVERSAEAGADDYARAVRGIHTAGRQVARFFEEYDVLITPTMATPPLELGRLSLDRAAEGYIEDVMKTIGFTSLFNATGNPAMSVPLHWNEGGLPIGVQFAGRYGDEATLYGLAAQLETAQPWKDRRP